MTEKVIHSKMPKDFKLKSPLEFVHPESKARHNNSNLDLKGGDFHDEVFEALDLYKERLDKLEKEARHKVQEYRAGTLSRNIKECNIDHALLLKIIKEKDGVFRDFKALLNDTRAQRYQLSKSDTKDIQFIYSFIGESEEQLTELISRL